MFAAWFVDVDVADVLRAPINQRLFNGIAACQPTDIFESLHISVPHEWRRCHLEAPGWSMADRWGACMSSPPPRGFIGRFPSWIRWQSWRTARFRENSRLLCTEFPSADNPRFLLAASSVHGATETTEIGSYIAASLLRNMLFRKVNF